MTSLRKILRAHGFVPKEPGGIEGSGPGGPNVIGGGLVGSEQERWKKQVKEWAKKAAKEQGWTYHDSDEEHREPREARITRPYYPEDGERIREKQEHEDRELQRLSDKLDSGEELTEQEKRNALVLCDNVQARGNPSISQRAAEMFARWGRR